MERVPPRTLERLTELLGRTPAECDVLVRLLYFLTREETDSELIAILNDIVDDVAFERRVNWILRSDDVKQLENDERYQSFMAEIRDNTLSYSNDEAGDGQRFGFDFISQFQSLLTATGFHLDRTMSIIPAAEQAAMAGAASCAADAALANKSAFIDAAKYLSSVSKCVPVVAAAVICIQLGYDVYCNVRKWWKGEISGKRCIKNILDSGIGMVVGGLAGGYGGEALGALITMHPAGAIVGGVVGALVGWGVTHAIIDRLTQKILDLPKSVALENAFRFLDLPITASNNQVNTQYRKLALIYHPDRPGGSVDKFLSLQLYVGIIKAEREEGPAPGAPASGVPRAPIQVTGDED